MHVAGFMVKGKFGRFWTHAVERLFDLDKITFEDILIRESVIGDIMDFAQENHPKEFVAFFHGIIRKKQLIIDALVYNEFSASENSAAPIFHFADKSFYGSVHSHPGPSNRPSRADISFFHKTGIIHAIICRPYTRESVRFYTQNGEPVTIKTIP